MVDKTEILKNEVDRILSDQGKSTICILINTDDYSGKFVKLAGEKLLLIDETDFIADNVCDSLERRMIEKYGLSKNNVEDLVSKGSEVNRELKRYIKSNRIINSILVVKMSCQTAEDELAEVKGNLTILVQQIQELIVIKNFQDICYLIYGKMSGNYLIERYLRESLSYDADLEDPLLYINSEIVDVGDFDKKKVLDSIQVALCGIDAKKEKVNLVSSRDRDKDFFGPIYVMKASTITLESECEVWNIELPFQISDNEAELIEVKLWNDENNENILLIKRLSSKKIYDFAL